MTLRMSSRRPASRPGAPRATPRAGWSGAPAAAAARPASRRGSARRSSRPSRADRGFTPGFASVLTCEDGSRHFVKAASMRAQRVFADVLPRGGAQAGRAARTAVPAPRLRWSYDGRLGRARHRARRRPAPGPALARRRPRRLPRRARDRGRAADPAARRRSALDPAVEEFAPFLAHWDDVRADPPRLPHLDDAAALAGQYADVVAGDTLVHTDVRDDNCCSTATGGRGLRLELAGRRRRLARLALPADRPPRRRARRRGGARRAPAAARRARRVHRLRARAGHGYFLKSAADPVPPTSPYLRDHQRWQGEVCWEWLCERRGWA